MNPAGTGTINATAQNCTGGYLPGTVVQLTVVPNSGYGLSSWSGDASGSANPVSVTMDGNKRVTANLGSSVVVLGQPNGDLASWANSFEWSGVSTATYYIYEIYNAGDVRLLQKWYTTAAAGCDGDLSCGVSPASTTNLANGVYTGG